MKKIIVDQQLELSAGSRLDQFLRSDRLDIEEVKRVFGDAYRRRSDFVKNANGCRATNLLDRIVMLGGNGYWYLTGEGPMFMDQLRAAGDESCKSEELLRGQAETVQYLIDQGMVKIPASGQLTAISAMPSQETMTETVDVPHYYHRIAAGLPTDSTSPSEKMSLPSALVKHPKDTFVLTVTGDSMTGAGIEEGDILVVDRAVEACHQCIVIASINGEQTVKRLNICGGVVSLMPENHHYPEIVITPEMDFKALGVVVWVIRRAT